jgi:hypothetical protein
MLTRSEPSSLTVRTTLLLLRNIALMPGIETIAEFLEETSVLGNTLDTKRLVLAPNGVDEVVVRDGDRSGVYEAEAQEVDPIKKTVTFQGKHGRKLDPGAKFRPS